MVGGAVKEARAAGGALQCATVARAEAFALALAARVAGVLDEDRVQRLVLAKRAARAAPQLPRGHVPRVGDRGVEVDRDDLARVHVAELVHDLAVQHLAPIRGAVVLVKRAAEPRGRRLDKAAVDGVVDLAHVDGDLAQDALLGTARGQDRERVDARGGAEDESGERRARHRVARGERTTR